jgi:rubrerythrin
MSNSTETIDLARRRVLAGTCGLALSGSAVALLGNVAHAQGMGAASSQDVSILNVAIGLEYEGINAYSIALKSGLLGANATKAAAKFRDDHKRHNELLISTVRKLGGEPVAEKSGAEYAKALNVDALKNETEVLELAAALELGATNAYLGVIPAFREPGLAMAAGRLAADEASHFALLNFDLGRPFFPALGFGA